ncbi:uncharacterized protein LAJ45_00509 [Morchella importuna]|uniref:uncharacterized protein n=1 Tax=Morchella importuna TaxID=1174673 RepID=UPI001E8E2FA2|nr:uncharacterized protein LAJ45_00509 [Morchella importuna]KAH8155499.1 hypothetical protein LAJ45_00509 [Morchella importuna]
MPKVFFPEKASKITSAFPNITTVIGDLDSVELLETQAANADIVIHTAICDEPGYAHAVIRGLEKRGGGYFIHTSGTALLFDEPSGNVLSEKIWDDIKDLKQLTSLPETAIHRPVEKVTTYSSRRAPPSVHTAIISPGKIYGFGTGPDKLTTTFFKDALVAAGVGFKIGAGINTNSTVHIQDLARLYTIIVGEALKPNGGAAQWDAEGYYFGVSDDEISVADHVSLQTKKLAASGVLSSDKMEVWPAEKVVELHPFFPAVFGSNARARASRGKALGWKTVEKRLEEWLSEEDA